MKKILLATTVLVAASAAAHAEVTLSGDARMGVVSTAGDLAFSSRARVAFTGLTTTDGGLELGASFRADNADEAADDGTAGSVFISGAFGKLTMGDVDGAAQQATGHVAGVGYTGIGDINESTFIGAGADPTALYEYSAGAFTGYASVSNPAGAAADTIALGAKYATDTFTVGAGYEDNGVLTHTVVKGSTTLSGVTLQALYGMASNDATQYAVSVGYSMDAIGVTAFYTDDSELGDSDAALAGVQGGIKGYGIGASYALGGGASLVGGVAKDTTNATTNYDLGVSFSF